MLENPDLFTLLELGLFVDPENHPRGPNAVSPVKPATVEVQAAFQRNSAEALQQLALFPSGREALQHEAAVLKALEQVAQSAMTPEAREHAEATLLALSGKEMKATPAGEGPKHIMLSYQVTGLLTNAPLWSGSAC